MTIGFLYKESMHWVSQIQSIRNELERVKVELRITNTGLKMEPEKIRLTKNIQVLGTNLDAAETILLTSLNNGTTYWAGHSQTYNTPRIDPCENEVFDRMKTIYVSYVELQRSISLLLTGQSVNHLALLVSPLNPQ